MSYDLDKIEAAVAEARTKGNEKKIKFEQSFDARKISLSVSICQKSIMAYPKKAFR